MKKYYESPQAEIEKFTLTDVVLTGPSGFDAGGDTEDPDPVDDTW